MASRVKKNYLYNLFYQVLLVIVPVITTPYLSRVLGSENVGIYSFTLSIVTYFTLAGSLGVGLYGRREIARYQDDVKKRTDAFWQINILKWIAIILSLGIYFFTCIKNGGYSVIYTILILEILSSAFDITWYFQGLENFKSITVRNTIIKLLSVVAIFVFVRTDADLWIYVLIHASSDLLGNLSLWTLLPKYIHKSMPTVKNARKHFLPILVMFLPQVAIQVYTVLDKTMLGLLTENMSETGIYEQSQKIVKITLALVTSLGTVMVPRIASLYTKKEHQEIKKEFEKAFHLVWYLALPICFGIIAVAPNIVPWFLGDEFLGAIPVMQIGAFLMISIGLNNVTGIQCLIPIGKENLFTVSVIVGAVINFVGNLILIPMFGATGAIVSSVIAETMIFIVQIFMVKGMISARSIFWKFPKPFIASAIMLAVTCLLGSWLTPGILNSVLISAAGVAVYGLVTLILREDWTVKYLKAALKILKRGK